MNKIRYVYPSVLQSLNKISEGWRMVINNQGFIVPDEPKCQPGDTINVILEIEERTDVKVTEAGETGT